MISVKTRDKTTNHINFRSEKNKKKLTWYEQTPMNDRQQTVFSALYYVVTCGLSSSTILSTLFHKQHNFLKIFIEHKMCVLILSTTSVWNNIPRVIQCTGLHIRHLPFRSDFNETWIFTTDFLKIFKYQISWKCINGSQVAPCIQTDKYGRVNSCFLQFCECAYKCYVWCWNSSKTAVRWLVVKLCYS